MKFCISFGKFELKYLFYCVLNVIVQLYFTYFIYLNELKIITEHNLLYSFCLFFGYLLNIIPALINNIKSKENLITNKLEKQNVHSIKYIYNSPYEKYLPKKEILNFLLICLILLLADIIENFANLMEHDKDYYFDESKEYSDDYILYEYLIIFVALKLGKEVYYKHQYISFFILILFEVIKNIYFFIKGLYKKTNIFSIILNIIYSILYAIYFLYIKGLIKYKFISPYKCNFMIGVINVPIIILMSFIISFTPLGIKKDNNDYYYDNIFELFKDLGNIDVKSAIILISLPFVFGINVFILIRIINDYSIFHIYIPFLIQYFIENIIQNFELIDIIFIISCFFIELIMILVFLEIIEIKFCGLNENLKRNIELRSMTESSLANENDDDDNDEINN